VLVVLLTDEGFTGFHGLSLALLAGAVAAEGAWIVVFGWRWLATRPKLPDAGLETREVARTTGDRKPPRQSLECNAIGDPSDTPRPCFP